MAVLFLFPLLTGCFSSALAERLPALPQHQRCETAADDRLWLGQALDAWPAAVRDYLREPEQPLPQVVTYDNRCSYTLAPVSSQPRSWSVAEHGGQITLPNKGKIPPAPNAFNAVIDGGHNFVAMALPSIWRPVAPKSEIPLEWFLEGVLLHELTHAYQSAVTPDISFPALLKRLPAGSNISDDSVQEAFEKNAAYVRDYELEVDLLSRAASAPSDNEARALACEAVDALRARRAQHFTGANAYWSVVDDISVTTEGLGQWVAYRWLVHGRRLAPSLVLSKLRGPYWSQEQGLVTFLVVDRLLPGWQSRLFSDSPDTADRLLALACAADGSAESRQKA